MKRVGEVREALTAALPTLVLNRDGANAAVAAAEASAPADVAPDRWREALDGLWVFVAAGFGDEAQRLGWSKDELFGIPPMWARIDLCGCALLIGDREVTSVEANRIVVKTSSGATQSFYRVPAPDLSLVHRERMKLLQRNLSPDEARLRSLDFTIDFARQHFGCDLEEAKARVRDALAKAKGSPTS
jgi:hypothetical protein